MSALPPTIVNDVAEVTEDLVLFADGNVFANDSDTNGLPLAMLNPGDYVGTYGVLHLYADGAYSYVLSNSQLVVQALPADGLAIDTFSYVAGDASGSSAAGTLTVNVHGVEDAPFVVYAVPDATLPAGTTTFAVQAAIFSDVDTGDVITYTATLADGSPLPSWIALTPIDLLEGTVPSTFTGTLNVTVTATDQLGLSASDTMALTFQASGTTDGTGGTGHGANGHGTHGNEGLGNGIDAPPPGLTQDFNDGSGTSPGHPGAAGGAFAHDIPHVEIIGSQADHFLI